MDAGGLANQLIDAGPDEVGELDFRNGPHSAESGAEGDAHNGRLGQRGVHHPLRPEILNKPLRRQEHAATLAHIFAHHEHPLVAFHFLAQRGTHRFNQRHLCHSIAACYA